LSDKVTSNAQILGEVVWLLTKSNLHRDWSIASIEQWVMPAISKQRFRLYHEGDKPVGYVSWAHMSQRAEKAYVKNTRLLSPDDWESGDRLWFVDFITPFGHAMRVTRDLKSSVFPDDVGRVLRWREDSDVLSIFYVHGRNMIEKAKDRKISTTVELM